MELYFLHLCGGAPLKNATLLSKIVLPLRTGGPFPIKQTTHNTRTAGCISGPVALLLRNTRRPVGLGQESNIKLQETSKVIQQCTQRFHPNKAQY